jgi:hypothetical protein
MIARILIVVGLVWLALLPPLFTGGACTAEYEAASSLISRQSAVSNPASALSWLQSQPTVQAQLLTPEDCAKSKPRFLSQCPSGALVMAEVPVRNSVCRLYRDSETRIRLQYDRRGQLIRTLSEMKPYKFLPLPWGGQIDWAR